MKMQSIFIFFYFIFFLRNKPKAEVYQVIIHLLNALGITQVHSILVQNKHQAKL